MRIAFCSDEPYAVHRVVRAELEARGHTVLDFGAMLDGGEHPWATVAAAAAQAIVTGECDEGVFFCWSGTGISMAANKLPGIRAALCTDAPTARAARVWNHANVLCLSNRGLSDDVAKEVMVAWFEPTSPEVGAKGVELLREVDERWRRPA
ncbi:MAG TPA: RpiB/LacA/LacB family sugar-phosphate isomerase [Polyangiaceae bacterium]|jgi:ribose 5-phosphate isomerase B|nr:RpiB/LacA/LacB family sugar-phosphate isomerase [Polyangiaceae bacterium]